MSEIDQIQCKKLSQWIGKTVKLARWRDSFLVPGLFVFLFCFPMMGLFMIPFLALGLLGTFPAGILGFMAANKIIDACERDYEDLLVAEGFWSREDAENISGRSSQRKEP